jgi:hypothetical protein
MLPAGWGFCNTLTISSRKNKEKVGGLQKEIGGQRGGIREGKHYKDYETQEHRETMEVKFR